jgi:hypothetical protein
MRKSIHLLLAIMSLVLTTACNDYETYGELKERERDAIDQFINDSGYVIISQDQFEEQGNKTIGDKQFVQLNKSGVYMQIVNVGSGETIKDGESMNILCRFIEKSILDTVKLSNYTNDNPFSLDIMSVTRTGSTYTASFTQGLMLNNYGSTVPEAWLAPLQYIKLGRLASDTDEKAHVKLIVPHSQGTTSNAKANVRPYYYIIKFQRGR